jgi:WD40 repeat protein
LSSSRRGRVSSTARSGTFDAAFAEYRFPATAVEWSPDAARLAVGGDDPIVRLIESRTSAIQAQLEEPAGWVISIAWSPDGRTLAAGGWIRLHIGPVILIVAPFTD